MILVGELDSPFVRRVAVALSHYGMPFERNNISAYDDFTQLLALNPLGTVPALQLADGAVLVDSTLILDYLERQARQARSLWPDGASDLTLALSHAGVALGLAGKAVEYRTETARRASEMIDRSRVDRILAQIAASLAWLEKHTPEAGFICGSAVTHADIASAAAVTFITNKNAEHFAAQVEETQRGFPRLLAHTARCEQLDAFKSAPFPADW